MHMPLGRASVSFPTGMDTNYPGQLTRFKRQVGNRVNIYLENAYLMLPMIKYYQKWTGYAVRRVRLSNALHVRLDSKLRCLELLAALYARALVWRQLMQLFRIASKENEVKMDSFKFCKYVQAIYEHAERMEIDPSFLFDSGFVAFDFYSAEASIGVIAEHYREFHSAADACTVSPPPEAKPIVIQMSRTYGTDMVFYSLNATVRTTLRVGSMHRQLVNCGPFFSQPLVPMIAWRECLVFRAG